MSNPLTDVPWGNLWRWIVSSMLFVLLLGMPIAFATSLDEGSSADVFVPVVVVLSVLIAATVVWSDDIPWIGDV